MPDQPTTPEIKRISAKEFSERGYLQEVNRKFLHLLGLALEITIDEDDPDDEGYFSGVWDYREDPEGIIFGGPDDYGLDVQKAVNVQRDRREHNRERIKLFGDPIQPLDPSHVSRL